MEKTQINHQQVAAITELFVRAFSHDKTGTLMRSFYDMVTLLNNNESPNMKLFGELLIHEIELMEKDRNGN